MNSAHILHGMTLLNGMNGYTHSVGVMKQFNNIIIDTTAIGDWFTRVFVVNRQWRWFLCNTLTTIFIALLTLTTSVHFGMILLPQIPIQVQFHAG